MPRYALKDDFSKKLRSLIITHFKDQPISNKNLEGTFTIKNIRRYSFNFIEVELEFKGKIYGRVGDNYSFYDSSLLSKQNISRIKVKKFLKKSIYQDIKNYLKLFSQDIHHYTDIKKMDWL